MVRPAIPLAVLLTLACAGSSQATYPLTPVPEQPAGESFVATGEVLTRDASAAFDDWRVVGPNVNLVRRPDGSWAGTLAGENLSVRPGPGSLVGSGAELYFVKWGNDLVVRGTLGVRTVAVRIALGPGLPTRGGIVCAWAQRSGDCTKEASTERQGIEFRGVAANLGAPTMPQLGLALVAIGYRTVPR
jgi:hypothetical protein